MSTDRSTARKRTLALGTSLALLTVLVVVGLLLSEYGPGNMGEGFLVGAAVALVAAAVAIWRVRRNPDSAGTFERAWVRAGDERDDAVLTQALAVLGLVAVPLTGVAAIAIGLGAAVEVTLALLLLSQVLVGAATFWVVNRRS